MSLLSGALIIVPLMGVARRTFGRRAAFWTAAAWIASPMAMRWSLQVMTDTTFALLWTGALASLVLAAEALRPDLFPGGESRTPDRPRCGQWLAAATALAVLATMTRYQGIFLAPLTLHCAWWLVPPRKGSGASRAWLWQLLWLAVPLWILTRGWEPLMNHFDQIGDRSGGRGFLFSLLHVYWNIFESFLTLSPYFVTWGLFAFMLFGVLRTNWATTRLRWLGWKVLYLTLAIFTIQAVFTSLQERYLLPLLPPACLFIGHGVATWERRAGARSWRFWGLVAPSLLYGLSFAALVAIFQGSPFLDIRRAAQFIRDELRPDTDTRIVTNERYADLVGIKVNYWSGDQPVAYLADEELRPGDLILISSYDAGGVEAYNTLLAWLAANPAVERVHEPWTTRIVPLFPDLMPVPYNQNPMAWHLRYLPQYFQTSLFRVRDLHQELLDTPPPPIEPDNPMLDAMIEELSELEMRLHGGSTTASTTLP